MIHEALASLGLSATLVVGALAAGAALFLRYAASRRAARDRERLIDFPQLRRMVRQPSRGATWGRSALVALGTGALAASLGPGGTEVRYPEDASARETVLVLDASNSMWARDVDPSRLERQRELATRLVTRVTGRVGVVYFAGHGYVLSPLTPDRASSLMFVGAVDPGLVGQGGTSLALGLDQGLAVLAGGNPGAAKALIVFSDGEATADAEALEEVRSRAVRASIPVFTVGLGTQAGGRIPVPASERERLGLDARGEMAGAEGVWLRDRAGTEVVSRLDETLLRELSRSTGAVYVPGTREGLDALWGRLERSAAGRPGRAGIPVQALLLLAFGCLFAEAYLFRRG